MKIKVIAITLAILAFFLFVCSPFQQAVKAIAGVDDAVIAIVIAALAAMGITFSAAAGYGSLQEYVEDLISEYAASRSMTPQALFSGVQSGTNKLGQVLLNNRFVQVISLFGEWLVNKFSLSNNVTVNVVSGSSTWGGLNAYMMPFVLFREDIGSEYTYYVYRSSGQPVYVLLQQDAGSNIVITKFVSKGSSQIQRVYYNTRNGDLQEETPKELTYDNRYSCYIATGEAYNVNDYTDLQNMYTYTQQEVKAALSGDVEEGGAPIDIITGAIDLPTESLDYDDEGAVLDLDAPWGTGYDDITDVVIPGIVASGEDADISIEYQEEEEIAEQVEDTPTQQVSQEATDYQTLGLQDVFPFCIPFDIYNFFSCLAAEPEAPSFEWRFYVPDICDETIEIDLSQFNTVAQIVRTMELLAFIVGLAFVTRDKMIKG